MATIATNVAHYIEVANAEARRTIQTGGNGLFADLRRTVRRENIGPGFDRSTYRKFGDLTFESGAENTAFSTDQTLASSEVILTTSRKGGKTTISDIADRRAAGNLGAIAGQRFGEAYIRETNRDLFALYTGFSRQVGTTNVNIAMSTIFDALTLLVDKNAPPPYYLAITPWVWGDLVKLFGVPTANFFNIASAITESAQQRGILPDLAGINILVVGDLASGASAGQRDAADINCGLYSREALAFQVEVPFRIRADEDIDAGNVKVVADTWYGVGEINDDFGVDILVDNKD
jgi:hypothetical protein